MSCLRGAGRRAKVRAIALTRRGTRKSKACRDGTGEGTGGGKGRAIVIRSDCKRQDDRSGQRVGGNGGRLLSRARTGRLGGVIAAERISNNILLTRPPRIRANKRMLTCVGWPRPRPAKLCPQGPKETPSIASLEPSGSMRLPWVWQWCRYVEHWNLKQLEQNDGKGQQTDECQMSDCKPKDERTGTVGAEPEKR